jgi:hypothetical protein
MNNKEPDLLNGLIQPARLTSVVDVGANPIDGDPPYKAMLQRRLCTVVGFEPQDEALAVLNARKSDLKSCYSPCPRKWAQGETALLPNTGNDKPAASGSECAVAFR